MAQYYRVFIQQTEKAEILDHKVNGEYMLPKLMEHSWTGNPFVEAVCSMLYQKPGIVAWVGDEANEYPVYREVWGKNADLHEVTATEFSLDGKYLVNHTEGEYLDYDKYVARSISPDGWIVHPLPLLTALGNGRGQGDYYGPNQHTVGSWAMDSISIEDVIPEGYHLLDIYFCE